MSVNDELERTQTEVVVIILGTILASSWGKWGKTWKKKLVSAEEF